MTTVDVNTVLNIVEEEVTNFESLVELGVHPSRITSMLRQGDAIADKLELVLLRGNEMQTKRMLTLVNRMQAALRKLL